MPVHAEAVGGATVLRVPSLQRPVAQIGRGLLGGRQRGGHASGPRPGLLVVAVGACQTAAHTSEILSQAQ